MKERVSRVLLCLFYGFFALCFAWIFAHATVGGGSFSYNEVLLLFYIACALCLLLFAWHCFGKHAAWLEGHSGRITLGFLLAMFTLQMVLGLRLRYEPVFDIKAVHNGAIEWLQTGSFASFYDYYTYIPTNFGAMFAQYCILRVASALGMTDYFLAMTIVNSLLSLLTIYATGAIGRKLLGVRGQMAAYAIYAITPPLYFLAPVFYTDTMSMAFPVLIYWLYLLAKGQAKLWKRLALLALMGVAAFIGFAIKATVLIAFVAIAIDAFFTWNWKRTASMLLVVATILLLGQAGLNHVQFEHLDRDVVEQQRAPLLNWVMMGLNPDGGAYNGTDHAFSRQFTDHAERDAALKAEIKKRIETMGAQGLLQLFTKKSSINFGDGTYKLTDCLSAPPIGESKLRELVTANGSHYKQYRHVCAGPWFAAMLLMIASALQEILVAGSASMDCIAPRLGVWGLMLFLLFWETNYRYTVNFAPMIYVCALLGLNPTYELAKAICKRVRAVCKPRPGIPEGSESGAKPEPSPGPANDSPAA